MKKKIIKKENGIITISEKEVFPQVKFNSKLFEPCFFNITNTNNNKNYHITNEKVQQMIKEIRDSSNGTTIVSELYSNLKEIETYEQLMDFIFLFRKRYNETITSRYHNSHSTYFSGENRILKTFDSCLKENPQTIINAITKKIISLYYFNLILNSGRKQINNLESLKFNNTPTEELLSLTHEQFSETSKQNGVYDLSKILFSDMIDVAFDRSQKHLCWDNCQNAYVSKCPKIADYPMKDINCYPFITNGYQIITDDHQEEKLVVTECSLYQKAKVYQKKKNTNQK